MLCLITSRGIRPSERELSVTLYRWLKLKTWLIEIPLQPKLGIAKYANGLLSALGGAAVNCGV